MSCVNLFRNKCVRDLPQSEIVSGFLTTYRSQWKRGTLTKYNGQKRLYFSCLRCLEMDKWAFKYPTEFDTDDVKHTVRRLARDVRLWLGNNGKVC